MQMSGLPPVQLAGSMVVIETAQESDGQWYWWAEENLEDIGYIHGPFRTQFAAYEDVLQTLRRAVCH